MKKTNLSLIALTTALIFTNSSYAADPTATNKTQLAPETFAACLPVTNTQTLPDSIRWYNQSAEKKAIYKEVYLMADNYIQYWFNKNHPKEHTWGIILDIDETTLDNSWFSVQCQNAVTPENNFEHYVSIPAKSTALPGVVHLTNLVHDLGGYVSFISNRNGSYSDSTGNTLDSTEKDLKNQGVYFDQIILSNYKLDKNPTNKNPRFQAVITDHYDKNLMVWSNTLPAHSVIAYFGDNIQDFPKLEQAQMHSLNWDDSKYNSFGRGYFIFPNPMYGSWQGIK